MAARLSWPSTIVARSSVAGSSISRQQVRGCLDFRGLYRSRSRPASSHATAGDRRGQQPIVGARGMPLGEAPTGLEAGAETLTIVRLPLARLYVFCAVPIFRQLCRKVS